MIKIIRFLDKYFEEFFVVLLLLYLVLGVNFEVFIRYILNASGAYMEEISKLTLISMVYIGIPYVIKKRKHIICNIFSNNINKNADFILSLIGNTLFIFFVCTMVYATYNLITMQIMMGKKTEAMHISIVYFTTILLIGFSLSIIRLLQNIIIDYINFQKK